MQVASLGAINPKNNANVCKGVSALLAEAPYGIKSNRIYVEFRDVAGSNMGYDGSTF